MFSIFRRRQGAVFAFVRLALALTSALYACPGFSHALSVAAPATHDQRAAELSQRLMALGDRHRHASHDEQTVILDEMRKLAAERRQRLAALIENDPAELQRLALPEAVRASLPSAVQSLIEQPVALEGKLQVLHVDYQDPGQSHYVYLLETDSGEHYSLHASVPAPGLLSGMQVRANGLVLHGAKLRDAGDIDGAVALADGESGLMILEAGGTSTTTATGTAPALLPNTFGAQNTAVVLVNFQNAPDNKPWTMDQARSLVFGPVSDFFRENSYNQTWLTGDVFGWFTLALDPSGCPTTDIAIAVNQAAGAKGIDLSAYSRVVYAFPDIGCPWSGEATVGGQPSRVWLDGTLMSAGVVSHELGHNFGLLHSHALECGVDVAGGNCTAFEYGDLLDRMGASGAGHFDAFQKERLGWLNSGVTPPVLTADTSGVYKLEPYAAQTQGPKALRVLRDVDPTTGLRTWYYLESRQAVGFDGFLSTSRYGASVLNGVVFRLATEGDAGSSFLLDTSPNSQTYDWDDMALPVGSTLTDAASGTTVTVNQVDAGGASISVSFGQPQCVHRNPAVTMSPNQGPAVRPGTAVSFGVSVTNNDSSACPSATVDLAGTVPAGWFSGMAIPSVTLAPGASASTTLAVTSPATVADGFYNIAATAVERGNAVYVGTGAATYVVSATANRSPVAVNDSAATSQNTAVAVNLLANDSDPDADPMAVTSVSQPVNGRVVIGSGGIVTYTPAGTFRGTDTFGYSIGDGRGGIASATVTVTVVRSGGKTRK